MKKIFLTSGLVICMACPTVASATGAGFVKTSIDQTGSGSSATFSANTAGTGNLSSYDNINTATNKDVANACVTGILGTTTDGATATLVAQWTPNFSTITLDKNTDTNGFGSSNFTPTTVYGVPGVNSVFKVKDSNNNFNTAVAVGEALVTAVPTGKQVNHTINPNFEYIAKQGGDTYTSSSSTYNAGTGYTAKTRAFAGAFSTQTGTGTASSTNKQYITADKKLTDDGLSAAQTNTTQTWYAQYSCATPTAPSTKPTLTGYTLATSFYKTRAANTYEPSGSITSCITDDDTVYAKWTPKTYTVTYNGAKPSADTSSNTVSGLPASGATTLKGTYDRGYTAATAPSLTGWTFNGWKANYVITTGAAAGTAASPTQSYSAGQVIANPSANPATRWKTDSNVTFVAQWTPNEYTITLDKNGGSAQGSSALYTKYMTGVYSNDARTTAFNTSSTITKPTGASTTLSYDLHLPTNPETNSAYTTPATPSSTTVNRAFSGYNDSGGTQRIDSSGKMTSTNITWAKGLTADTTLTAQWGDASHTVAASQSLAGYTFGGWWTAATGGTQVTSATYGISSSTTLHGRWTAYTGTLTFNCGKQADGTTNVTGNGPADMTWTYDAQVTGFPLTVTTSECSYPGYVFAGWDCNYSFSTTGNPTTSNGHYVYAAETTGTNRGTIVGHNPNYHNNNGTYTGWYHPANGSGTITNGATITCTATWMPGSITVKWNKNNATSADIADGSCTYDSSVTLPTNPTRTGYIFNGWNVQ